VPPKNNEGHLDFLLPDFSLNLLLKCQLISGQVNPLRQCHEKLREGFFLVSPEF
jgi:hypothetical protein